MLGDDDAHYHNSSGRKAVKGRTKATKTPHEPGKLCISSTTQILPIMYNPISGMAQLDHLSKYRNLPDWAVTLKPRIELNVACTYTHKFVNPPHLLDLFKYQDLTNRTFLRHLFIGIVLTPSSATHMQKLI